METIRTLIQRFKDGSIKEMWNEWKWIYSYARNYKKEILFYIIIGMFSTILGLIGSLASRDLIDTVTGHITSNIAFITTVIVSMAIFKLLFGAFCSRISIKINIRIQNDIQSDIFDKIIHVNWSELSKYHSGDLLNRFGSDVSTVAGSVIGWFPSLINSLFSLFCSFCLIMYFDPIMAAIALLNAPVMLLTSNFLMDRMRQHSKQVKEMSSEMVSFQEESFHNIDSIKSFNLSDIFSTKLVDFQKKFAKLSLDYQLFTIKTNICLSLLGMIVQYSCFGWGVYRLWTGYITYGTMTIFLGLARSLSANFNAVISVISSTVSSTTSAGRILEIINLEKETIDEEELNELMELDEFKLEMNGVDFSYVKDKPVLQKVNFEALPGQIVGLVGPSGEGKTTMIRLLLGLTKPDSGSSLLVSKNKSYTLDACTRNLFAYVPQGNTIFSGTIRENLKMVKQDASEEEMINALKLACAYDFVFAKPEGLDAEIGERGRGLSEGQAQRIAIARALLRDAPVLLLDEATSALDVNTERQILKHIMANDSHRICIVTSHRPSVLNLCHQVYEIKHKNLKLLTNLEVENLINDF